jgi:hypothetical protein
MRAHVAVAVAAVAFGVACSGASSDPGYGDPLQIPNAQYRPGSFPEPTGGPDTVSFTTVRSFALIGEVREQLNGLVGPTAHGAIVGVQGGDGSWILTAGPPSFESGSAVGTVGAGFGIATDEPAGPLTLEMAAVDGDGHVGAPRTVELTAEPVPPPTGALVVGLVWDTNADLDLHVIDPSGSEAFTGHPNTIDRPDPMTCECNPNDPAPFYDGGILDHDGNFDCTRDGNPSEHVIWQAMPERGKYTVRVEARAMCGAPSSPWYVEVFDDTGALLHAARGVSTQDDVTFGSHGPGAGVTALTFDR